MNTKFISRYHGLSIFVDKEDRIVDWRYGTDPVDDDGEHWYGKAMDDGGNADVFESAIRYVTEHGVDDPKDLPGIYLTPTENVSTEEAGPPLLLLEWPIMEKNGQIPYPIFSVHTTNDDGEIRPPLPDVLARRFAKAATNK